MQNENAKKTLKRIIGLLLLYLEELSPVQDLPNEQFQYGEKIAYTECLEWLQQWRKSKKYGLDFNIEKRYPL